MRHSFRSVSPLRPRWPIVEQVLSAHDQRMYGVSIPALFAQVEGLFSDALIIKGSVICENGKLFAMENDQKKLDRKGRYIQLHGLKQVIQSSDLKNSPLLEPIDEALANRLFATRNDVMHGRSSGYCQAKRSVTLIVAAGVLASMFAQLES